MHLACKSGAVVFRRSMACRLGWGWTGETANLGDLPRTSMNLRVQENSIYHAVNRSSCATPRASHIGRVRRGERERKSFEAMAHFWWASAQTKQWATLVYSHIHTHRERKEKSSLSSFDCKHLSQHWTESIYTCRWVTLSSAHSYAASGVIFNTLNISNSKHTLEIVQYFRPFSETRHQWYIPKPFHSLFYYIFSFLRKWVWLFSRTISQPVRNCASP